MAKQKKQKEGGLPVVHPHAAGIDVGSRTHFVATGQNPEQVRSFGVYQSDLVALSGWLKEEAITTIAMESTGSYWKGLFEHLQRDGFEVILVNGKHTRNVKGRKTDVLDCQWIQRLHSLGLLSGSFLPDDTTAVLRQYTRQRDHLIEQGSTYIRKMSQALRQMNIRLDVAIRDITGVSGRAIVEAILNGERDPYKLAALANYRVKKSKEEIAMSLEGNWREEYLFELRLSYELYLLFHQKVAACEAEIENLLYEHLQRLKTVQDKSHEKEEVVETDQKDKGKGIDKKKIKRTKKKNKNAPDIALEPISTELCGGINLYQIEGVSDATVLTLISEVGLDLSRFPTAKHFASWLALTPNNRISGGRVMSSHTAHHNNRLGQALRRAANAIGNSKEGKLSQFFRRIAFKYGWMAAITATARKLAVIIWNMLTKGEPYRYEQTAVYTERIRRIQLKSIKKKITALQINAQELGFTTT